MTYGDEVRRIVNERRARYLPRAVPGPAGIREAPRAVGDPVEADCLALEWSSEQTHTGEFGYDQDGAPRD